MRQELKILILIVLFILSFALKGFPQYAELVGEWVEIHGPYCWDTLGLARDTKTQNMLQYGVDLDDKYLYNTMLDAYTVRRIKKNTKAIVLEINYQTRWAKVALFTGLHKRVTGWIPLEWLKGNEKRPRIGNFYQKKHISDYRDLIYDVPYGVLY